MQVSRLVLGNFIDLAHKTYLFHAQSAETGGGVGVGHQRLDPLSHYWPGQRDCTGVKLHQAAHIGRYPHI